jgi:bifunctional DNA-binding transcriptional regulator/antitoxin component of YhaV-PrlF toxin-antitoxin module
MRAGVTLASELLGTLDESGRLAVPEPVLGLLGLAPGDRVYFRIDGSEVRIERLRTLDEVAGSVKPAATPEDWSARIREAKEEYVLRKYGKRD